jgi:hypothetical protein
MNYKFKKIGKGLELSTDRGTRVILKPIKGHVHVKLIPCRSGKRKQGLSSVTSDLNSFELKAVAIHFYKLLESGHRAIKNVNYADVFGSRWY